MQVLKHGYLFLNPALRAWTTELTFIRWKRKPRWYPPVKSKLFKFRQRQFPEPDICAEQKALDDRWRFMARSLWLYQRNEHLLDYEANFLTRTGQGLDAEIDRVIQENEIINTRIRERRAQIEEELWEEKRKEIIAKKEELELQELERLHQVEEEIKLQVERLKSAITLENIDEAIEKCLNTEIDYNFAVDKKGNIYSGRYNTNTVTLVQKTPEDSIEPVQIEISQQGS